MNAWLAKLEGAASIPPSLIEDDAVKKDAKQKPEVQLIEVSIPTGPPTRELLIAEAKALPPTYTRVSVSTADALAESAQMQPMQRDVADLVARGFRVTNEMFMRLVLLSLMLADLVARRMREMSDRKRLIAISEQIRAPLMVIRERIASLAAAAGVDTGRYSLSTLQSQRLNELMLRMSAIIINAEIDREQMPDRPVFDALVAEGKALLARHQSVRDSADGRGESHAESADMEGRLKYLLMQVLRHLSKQGIAAYPGDISRRNAYELEIIRSRKHRRAPGAPASENDVTEEEEDVA